MIIDSKLSGFKSYFSENRLNNGGVKTTINQSAVAPSEQNNVDTELNDSIKNSQDRPHEKKKEKRELVEEKKEEKTEKVVVSEAESKSRNLKLLNLL